MTKAEWYGLLPDNWIRRKTPKSKPRRVISNLKGTVTLKAVKRDTFVLYETSNRKQFEVVI